MANQVNTEEDTRTQTNEEDIAIGVNYGYAVGKLMRATEKENVKQVRKWETFVESWQQGKLSVGTRLPVSGAPAWVTLEVANGGFATGGFMAGGPLLPHETEYYKYFFNQEPKSDAESREKLNNEFISARGMRYLSHLLETSQFELKTPEEGALLAVAWLLDNNHEQRAKEILQTISPFFNQLRFYPIPSLVPLTMGAEVSVASVAQVVDGLACAGTPGIMVRMREAVDMQLPLYDALVAAVLKTTAQAHAPAINAGNLEGDLPFEVMDDARKEEIQKVIKETEKLAEKPRRLRCGHWGVLLKLAKKATDNPADITPKNKETARKILAQFNTKRGLPGSSKLVEVRGKQKKYVERIGVVDKFAAILTRRLAPDTSKAGIANLSEVLRPAQKNEAFPPFVVEGQAVPPSLVSKVTRGKLAPVDELCADGLVPSAEVLGVLCPAVVASMLAKGITDRKLAALYGAIYRAFKDRRSLLLLNLEKQVDVNEIPWFAALDELKPKLKKAEMEGEGTQRTLEDMVMLALKFWPETIMPNKFIGTLYDLSASRGNAPRLEERGVPFMKELASDIFMGRFSGTFLQNAKIAADMMRDTLYEKYYDLDYNQIANFQTEDDLNKYCGASGTFTWNVTENGKIIERCMMVTTHNLALVFDRLGMKDKLKDVMPELPRKIINFIIRETHNLTGMDWQTRLQHLKNAAYAFRQMVFFLSFLSKEEQKEFFEWTFQRVNKIKDQDYKDKLLLPINSLHTTWKESQEGQKGTASTNAQQEKKEEKKEEGTEEKKEEKTIFRGWMGKGERHFLMPPKQEGTLSIIPGENPDEDKNPLGFFADF